MLGKRVYGRYLTVGVVVLIAVMMAGVALAAVFVVYQYPTTSTNSIQGQMWLEHGPNYANANQLGLVYGAASSGGQIVNGATLYINGTSGAGDVYLLNVFQVTNQTKGVTSQVHLYINGTLPSGVTLYFDNTTQMTFSGTDAGAYSIVQGATPGNGTLVGAGSSSYLTSGAIPLTGTHTLYISFMVIGTVTGIGSLDFQLSVS